MGTDLLEVRPEETLRDAGRRMVERWVGSAIVYSGASPGLFTERHVVQAVGAGADAEEARVADHYAADATSARPDWTMEQAAEKMVEDGSGYLVVTDGGATVGIVSMRDVVRCWMTGRWRGRTIPIREAMSRDFIRLGRDELLEQAAQRMSERDAGAAVVDPPKPKAPPGLVTDREVLKAVGTGEDPATEEVGKHLSERLTFCAPDWSLRQAAEAMAKGGFQHVIVVDGTGTVGVISIREVVGRLLD